MASAMPISSSSMPHMISQAGLESPSLVREGYVSYRRKLKLPLGIRTEP